MVQIMAWRLDSHYLNQWCLVYQRIYASLGLNEELQAVELIVFIHGNEKPWNNKYNTI